jgi:hypothetical protein
MAKQSSLIKTVLRLKAGLSLMAALSLAACGGGGSGTGANSPAPPANAPPSANAGIDQTTSEQVMVTLDGTASSDSDGTVATVSWTQTAGVDVVLNDATAMSATFIAPTGAAGQSLTFDLIVTDDDGAAATDSVVINITSNPALGGPYTSNPDLSGQFADLPTVSSGPITTMQ